jgi:hypothetical protein
VAGAVADDDDDEPVSNVSSSGDTVEQPARQPTDHHHA